MPPRSGAPRALALALLGGTALTPCLCPQDLKPGNLAVNEDCELKVCVGLGARALPHTRLSARWAPALRPRGGLAQAHADGPDPNHPGRGRGPRAALGG